MIAAKSACLESWATRVQPPRFICDLMAQADSKNSILNMALAHVWSRLSWVHLWCVSPKRKRLGHMLGPGYWSGIYPRKEHASNVCWVLGLLDVCLSCTHETNKALTHAGSRHVLASRYVRCWCGIYLPPRNEKNAQLHVTSEVFSKIKLNLFWILWSFTYIFLQ